MGGDQGHLERGRQQLPEGRGQCPGLRHSGAILELHGADPH